MMKKGNILIGQSGGPTSVINASLCGVVQSALSSSQAKVMGMRYGIKGYMNGEKLEFNSVSDSVIEGLKRTPGSALGSSRYKLKDDDLPEIKSLFQKDDIRYFFLIGGNDTMDTVNRIEKYCRETGYELHGIGIPKTVDNDLYGTDHTPGYGSAARFNALCAQQGGRLAADMQRVDRFTVMQTVGREAGWLAGAAALGKKHGNDAPHLIYMPEIKLNREKVVQDVKNTIEEIGWCHIVIGEGVLWDDGTPVSASTATDNFSNTEFGAMGGSSAAINLHSLIHDETGFRGEFQVLESLPMCGVDRVSLIDREEAYGCGVYAVDLVTKDQTAVMVSIKRISSDPYETAFGTVSLENVAVRAKPMPVSFINKEGNYITKDFIEYASPLAGDFEEYSVL
jgi:6-phosphofructokinase